MKRVFATLVLLTAFYHAFGQLPGIFELDKFIVKNWRNTEEQKTYCRFFYYSIIVDTDKLGIIRSWKFNNFVPPEVKKDFRFLIGFQFPEKYRLQNSRILFYITVDQSIVCPKATTSIAQPREVMTEVLENIATEMDKDPQLKIIYRPLPMKYYKTIVD